MDKIFILACCGVWTYLKDILVFAASFADFLVILKQVLSLPQSAAFKVSLGKCGFAVSQNTFLGFVLSKEGKKPDPAKAEAILRIPQPTTVKRSGLDSDCQPL